MSRKHALELLVCVTLLIVCGCQNFSTPPISVNFPGGDSQTIQQGQSLPINAQVTNDRAGKGVTWSLAGPGTLKSPMAGSVEYDAPSSVNSVQAATVTATSIADSTKSAAFTVTVTYPPVPLVEISSDTFSGGMGEHLTEVEPDTFAFGSTMVSTFQVSRILNGAAMAVGFATSTDGGTTWTSGLLPGITKSEGGTFDRSGDPSVAHDAAHGQWLILTGAGIDDANGNPAMGQLEISRSSDGLTWGAPIAVNAIGQYDKSWIACDSTPSSPFYGNCYAMYVSSGSVVKGIITVSISKDGGLTWQAPLHSPALVHGTGTQQLVQPNGTVIVPMEQGFSNTLLSFISSDGGASWSATTVLASLIDHAEDGNLRSPPLPSAEMDAAGTAYVVWQDCRFRLNCAANDIVLATSIDGVNWTSPTRIPIDPVDSNVDHFLPGLAVDRSTSGAAAHLTMTYYYYPVSACGSNCDLYVGFISSTDGGQTWTAPTVLAGPMKVSWLAQTGTAGDVAPLGMVADYISTSYVNGNAFSVFAVAKANSGSVLDEAMYTTAQPMRALSAKRFSSRGEKPVPNAKPDHPPRESSDENREHSVRGLPTNPRVLRPWAYSLSQQLHGFQHY